MILVRVQVSEHVVGLLNRNIVVIIADIGTKRLQLRLVQRGSDPLFDGIQVLHRLHIGRSSLNCGVDGSAGLHECGHLRERRQVNAQDVEDHGLEEGQVVAELISGLVMPPVEQGQLHQTEGLQDFSRSQRLDNLLKVVLDSRREVVGLEEPDARCQQSLLFVLGRQLPTGDDRDSGVRLQLARRTGERVLRGVLPERGVAVVVVSTNTEFGGDSDNETQGQAEVFGQGDSAVQNGRDHGLSGGLLGDIVCVVPFVLDVIADVIGLWYIPFEECLEILRASITIEIEDVLQLVIRVDFGEGFDEFGELVDASDQGLQLVVCLGFSREASQPAHLSRQVGDELVMLVLEQVHNGVEGNDAILAGLGASPAVVSKVAFQDVRFTILVGIEIAVQGKHALLDKLVEQVNNAIIGYFAQTVHDLHAVCSEGTLSDVIGVIASIATSLVLDLAVSIAHKNIGVVLWVLDVAVSLFGAVGVHIATLGLELGDGGLHAIDECLDVVGILRVVEVRQLQVIMLGTKGSKL
ncbi:hypothetical protein PG984_007753 [Apiospora sp. TS-2023a]